MLVTKYGSGLLYAVLALVAGDVEVKSQTEADTRTKQNNAAADTNSPWQTSRFDCSIAAVFFHRKGVYWSGTGIPVRSGGSISCLVSWVN